MPPFPAAASGRTNASPSWRSSRASCPRPAPTRHPPPAAATWWTSPTCSTIASSGHCTSWWMRCPSGRPMPQRRLPPPLRQRPVRCWRCRCWMRADLISSSTSWPTRSDSGRPKTGSTDRRCPIASCSRTSRLWIDVCYTRVNHCICPLPG